jgi:Holliday junction resolvasome RuvABC endonuclease subunit
MARYLGIDPGVTGGIAILRDDGTVVETYRMPATERDLLDLLAPWPKGYQTYAVLERVSASPQMGVVSAFTFGRGYGALLMALTAAYIPFDQVTPQTWQKALGCLSKGEKNITKRRAQQLFPDVKVTHAIADALLLAEFGRRTDPRLRGVVGNSADGFGPSARVDRAGDKSVVSEAPHGEKEKHEEIRQEESGALPQGTGPGQGEGRPPAQSGAPRPRAGAQRQAR